MNTITDKAGAATAPLCGSCDWVERSLERIESRYLGAHGVLATVFDAAGRVVDEEPLVADFGDVLPFMEHFGRSGFVARQIAAARPFLDQGLYSDGGRIRLFSNHDWLLGLLELYRATGDGAFLDKAAAGATALIEGFFVKGLLLDEQRSLRHPKTLLCGASPFNGGFIELWLELHQQTGEPRFLQAAQKLAAGWSGTAGFRHHGVFGRVLCAYSGLIDRALRPATRMSARLFKDNTNLVWGLLELHRATGESRWRTVIEEWLAGFERYFFNDGLVWLWLDRDLRGQEVILRAAFPSIDLLCDLAAAGIAPRKCLQLAERIAARWIQMQWDDGLFPEGPGRDFDHLDSNVDMAIALLKLAGMTGTPRYAEAAAAAAHGTIARHEREHGFVLAVGKDGRVVDGRIIVKYQALLLKLAVAPRDPQALLGNPHLLYLLRDR